MEKIRCNHCGRMVDPDELIIWTDDPSPAGIALPGGYYTYRECPHCNSDDLDDSFSLIDALDIEEVSESSVIIEFEGVKVNLYIDEVGDLEMVKIDKPKKPLEITKREGVA